MKKITLLLALGITLLSCGSKSELNQLAEASIAIIETIKLGEENESLDPKRIGEYTFKNEPGDQFGLSVNPTYFITGENLSDKLSYTLTKNGGPKVESVTIGVLFDLETEKETYRKEFKNHFSDLLKEKGYVYDEKESLKEMLKNPQAPQPYFYNNDKDKRWIDLFIDEEKKTATIYYNIMK